MPNYMQLKHHNPLVNYPYKHCHLPFTTRKNDHKPLALACFCVQMENALFSNGSKLDPQPGSLFLPVCLSLVEGITLLNSRHNLLVEFLNLFHLFIGLQTRLLIHSSRRKIKGAQGLFLCTILKEASCILGMCLIISKLSIWEKQIHAFALDLIKGLKRVSKVLLVISVWPSVCG